jgi:hypothetical protein
MEQVLDSLRRIVNRWANTQVPLESDVTAGDDIIEVKSTNRFLVGDELMIRNGLQGETPLVVDEIISNTELKLSDPVNFSWESGDIVQKTFNQMFLKQIYLGEPDVIPQFPAVTINATTRDSSEWLTLRSTKEVYNIEISIYVLDSWQERGYRFLLQLTEAIETGLKRNLYPLLSPFHITSLTEDAEIGHTTLFVNDTSIFKTGPDGKYTRRIMLENQWYAQEARIREINETDNKITIDLPLRDNYDAEDTHAIAVERFIFNSWPQTINYGKIFKGTMLKASVISWFGWEEEGHLEPPIDISLH